MGQYLPIIALLVLATLFGVLWGILFINVTAGIGILAQASPMMQDMFHRTPIEAAAVVSLISIFKIFYQIRIYAIIKSS